MSQRDAEWVSVVHFSWWIWFISAGGGGRQDPPLPPPLKQPPPPLIKLQLAYTPPLLKQDRSREWGNPPTQMGGAVRELPAVTSQPPPAASRLSPELRNHRRSARVQNCWALPCSCRREHTPSATPQAKCLEVQHATNVYHFVMRNPQPCDTILTSNVLEGTHQTSRSGNGSEATASAGREVHATGALPRPYPSQTRPQLDPQPDTASIGTAVTPNNQAPRDCL